MRAHTQRTVAAGRAGVGQRASQDQQDETLGARNHGYDQRERAQRDAHLSVPRDGAHGQT